MDPLVITYKERHWIKKKIFAKFFVFISTMIIKELNNSRDKKLLTVEFAERHVKFIHVQFSIAIRIIITNHMSEIAASAQLF